MIIIRKAPHRSPQPQRPTNQVGCDTERNPDDCDFKQAFDWVQDGRLDDITWGYRCTSGDQYLVSGIGLPARYSFYVAPRAKRLNQTA
jgi:hypothetical protein